MPFDLLELVVILNPLTNPATLAMFVEVVIAGVFAYIFVQALSTNTQPSLMTDILNQPFDASRYKPSSDSATWGIESQDGTWLDTISAYMDKIKPDFQQKSLAKEYVKEEVRSAERVNVEV